MKDRVFGTDRFGFAYNTEALEKLLKEEFGTSMRLDSVVTPRCVNCVGLYDCGILWVLFSCRVIVTAVYKKTTMPELHFFNNCFHDEFSTRELLVLFSASCIRYLNFLKNSINRKTFRSDAQTFFRVSFP